MREFILLVSEAIGAIGATMLASASATIQRRPPLKFVYPKRDGIAALAFSIILLLSIPILHIAYPKSLLEISHFQALPGIANPILPLQSTLEGIATAILLCLVTAFLYFRKQPLLSIGIRKGYLRTPIQLGIALAVISLFIRGSVFTLINHYTPALGVFLIAALMSAIAQEVTFRGYIQLRLSSWAGNGWGLVITSLINTIWCVGPLLITPQISLIIIGQTILYRFLLGILLGWILQKGGSILPTILFQTVHLWLFWAG